MALTPARYVGGGWKTLHSVTGSGKIWSNVISELTNYLPSDANRKRNCVIQLSDDAEIYRYVGNNLFVITTKNNSGNLSVSVVDFNNNKTYRSVNGAAFTEVTSGFSAAVYLRELEVD